MIELPELGASEWTISILDAAAATVLAEHDPGVALKTASVGKLFALIEAARALETGELDPAERLMRTADDMLPYISLWDLLDQADLSVRDLCQLTAAVSDNTATNVLLRRLGLPAVQATTRALGFERSRLLDRVRAERTPDLPETLSRGSGAELANLMVRLHRDDIISPQVSGQVRAWIGANVDTGLVAAPFGLDPLEHNLFDRGVWLINKTGSISTARADVGLIRTPERAIAYAVVANWADDTDPYDDVLAAMQAIGESIRALLLG